MIWRIGADWKCAPDLHTEVEVGFTSEGDGVRVDLEHRNLEAYGDRAEQVKAAIDREGGGWGALLSVFAAAAEA